jgi:hypothetical protein
LNSPTFASVPGRWYTDTPRISAGQRGLAHAGQVFDEQMATRQQASERKADLLRLAEYDLFGLADDILQVL